MARKCINCDEIIEDDSLFCPKCGRVTQEEEKVSSYPVKWIAIASLCIILIVAGGFFLSNNNTKTDTSLAVISDSHLGLSNEYSVQLKDADNNALADKFIVVEFLNETYTLKTDSNGIASINLTVSDGTYEIKASFAGDDTYNEAHTSDTIVK